MIEVEISRRSCHDRAMVADPVARLSKRQRACLLLVADLKKTEQIAAALGISPSTVNTHIERAVTILGASGRRDAALRVLAFEQVRGEKIPTEIKRLDDDPIAASIPAATTTTPRRQRNDLSWGQRMIMAVAALALLCIAIAGLGAAIEQLSDWRASVADRNNLSRSH